MHLEVCDSVKPKITTLKQRVELTNGDSINHHSDFRYAPAHNDSADRQLLLERSAECEETAKVQWHGDVASPSRIQPD